MAGTWQRLILSLGTNLIVSCADFRCQSNHVRVGKYSHNYTCWHEKTGTFEKPNKNWRNPRKKIIDKNWTITTCLLRDSNPNYQCLKITSCRWRPSPGMHSFTATTHFKFSVLLCHSVCVACSAELLSLKRQVVMVQFQSINFFLGFLQFLLSFSKVPVFLCHSVWVFLALFQKRYVTSTI